MDKIMKMLGRIICWLEELWNLIRYMEYISGHEYVEMDNGDLVCSRCGHVSPKA